MLPSSSGLGRQPPQAGNGGSNPSGSAIQNTLCPKIGERQWTCTYDECNCHLKERIPMLPSSSGQGRQPPQAGNACSNHAGSAITSVAELPIAARIVRCPYSGEECDCKQFPWLRDGYIPAQCTKMILEKAPAMSKFRKLLPSSSGQGRQPPQAGNACSNHAGSATHTGVAK